MGTETLNVEQLKKERSELKNALFVYRYGVQSGHSVPEFEAMERRFREVTNLLRPAAKA